MALTTKNLVRSITRQRFFYTVLIYGVEVGHDQCKTPIDFVLIFGMNVGHDQ